MSGTARDDGGEDGKATTEGTATAKVPSLLVFRYADRGDVALMAVGTVAAVANGMSEPLMTLVFAAVIECFGAGDDSTVLHRISKVPYIRACASTGRFSFCVLLLFHAAGFTLHKIDFEPN
jgi:ATP-binding cassette subfamily B (MDR/TAP) protein 1